MSAKLVHVNAKTAWQPIKCPKAEIFDGLLDCHELTYYELAGNQVFYAVKSVLLRLIIMYFALC